MHTMLMALVGQGYRGRNQAIFIQEMKTKEFYLRKVNHQKMCTLNAHYRETLVGHSFKGRNQAGFKNGIKLWSVLFHRKKATKIVHATHTI